MSHVLIAASCKEINHRNLNHCVATRLLQHCSTCHAYKNLAGKSRIVDLHIKLKELVLSLSADTLAHKVYSMTHILELVNRLYLHYMGLIIYKVWICLDCVCNILKLIAVKEFNVNHTSVDSGSYRNCH